MWLRRIDSVRKRNQIVEERDLLGCLVGAFIGGRAQIGQLRTAGGRQWDRISAASSIPATQSRKYLCIG